MTEEDERLFTLANTAALVLFREHGMPPTLALSQKVLAEQGMSLLQAYKETVVTPAMEELGKHVGLMIAADKEEIERLRKALAPFAMLGERLAGNNHEAASIKQCFFHAPGIDALNAGHLKAAVAAMKG